MYLLTYEVWPVTEGRTNWRTVVYHLVTEEEALKQLGYYESLAVEHKSVMRNVELFEKRGNDWIRIRPEGEG